MINEIPNVHLFQIGKLYYIFDVNTNSIVKVNCDVYKYLHNILNVQKIDQIECNCIDDIEFLQSSGLLKARKEDTKIEHPLTDQYSDMLKTDIKFITLQVTQNCNLRCSYCVYSGSYINRVHNNKRMDLDVAKRAVDYYYEHSSNIKSPAIGFYGGEPLLEFELIKNIVNYADKKFKDRTLDYYVTTNATLLTDEIIEFFKNNRFHITISLDGPIDIQDRNRRFAENGKGTFNTVIENIEHIRKKYPDFIDDITFNAVMDEKNDFTCTDRFFMNYEQVKDMNLTATIINDNSRKVKIRGNEEQYCNQRYETFLTYLSLIGRLKNHPCSKIVLQQLSGIEGNIFKRTVSSNVFGEKTHPAGPCIPGINRLFCNAYGALFPCERVSETSPVMKIGNIYDGIDEDKGKTLLNIGKITEDECKNCWAFTLCGQCPTTADGITELSRENRLSKCKVRKYIADENLKEYAILKYFDYDFNL